MTTIQDNTRQSQIYGRKVSSSINTESHKGARGGETTLFREAVNRLDMRAETEQYNQKAMGWMSYLAQRLSVEKEGRLQDFGANDTVLWLLYLTGWV